MTSRWHWQLAAVGALVLVMMFGFSALDPTSARASWLLGLPSPGDVISGLLGGIGSVIGGTVGKLAVTAFDAIIHALFAPIAKFINTQLIGWLVAVPDYARPGSHVAATEQTVLAMAGAALAAVATISIARFWVAGLAGSGGSALEGLARTVGAAMLLPIWPWMFHTSVALANDASTGLLGSGSVTKSSANLLAVGVGAGVGLGFLGVGLFVSIVMAVIASVLFLGLLMMKVALAVSTVLVFIGMPIAIVLSPVVSWIPRVLARAFAVCLAVPFIWAVCFAASAAMLNDGLFLKGSSGFFNALLEPLAAIAMLWLMLLLPSRLAQMAMLGAGAVSGGFVSRAVSYAAGSQLRDSARQHMPSWAGGHGGSSDQRSRSTDSRLGARLSAESVLAASKAASAGGAAGAAAVAGTGAASGAGSGRSNGAAGGASASGSGWLHRVRGGGDARAYSPPPMASQQSAVAASGGLQRPSWRQEDFDAEMLEASLREQRHPVSAEQARQALDALPVRTQGAVRSLVADHGPRAQQHLAYQALGEWTGEQREAIRTLAAASPEVRAQAFSVGGESTAGFGETAEPATRTAGASGGGSPATAATADTTGNGGNGTGARTPQDQPRPDDGGGS
ncbi:MAG: hypothetical protein ACLP22_10715 [Solirubrobacteraceae bacterium]